MNVSSAPTPCGRPCGRASALLCCLLALAGCQTLPPPDRGPTGAAAPPAAAQRADAAGGGRHTTTTTTTTAAGVAAEADAPTPRPPRAAAGKPCAEAADLWLRIHCGMAMPALEHPLVLQHAQRFASTGFLDKRADRIRLYMPLIVEEIEQRGLPLELALLPLVESALNPHARSPVGALGPWQFMQPTARRFQLRTSRLVDDRKNLRQATRAALDYLQKLHAQFGDWHLAMAAYNWGEGRVQKAVDRQRATGGAVGFDTLAPRMPAETRNYVPQIMALALLVAQPLAIAGHVLPEMPNHNPLVEVDLAHDTDLPLVLRFAGLGQAQFLSLNPAVKPPLVLAAATPRLLLPEAAALRFEAAQAAHPGHTASFKVVRLLTTQPVDAIALAHGASAAGVRAANDIPRGMKPVQGSVLLLPTAVPAGTRADGDLVADAHLQTTADVVALRVAARKGESPQALARRCGVAPASLAGWNQLGRKQLARPLAAGTALTLWVLREAPGVCARGTAGPAAAPARPQVAAAGHALRQTAAPVGKLAPKPQPAPALRPAARPDARAGARPAAKPAARPAARPTAKPAARAAAAPAHSSRPAR